MKTTLFLFLRRGIRFLFWFFSDSAGLSDSYFQRVPQWGGVGGGVGEGGGRVGWEMVKGGLKEDDLLQVLGFLMMGIFRSVSNFQVGLHF